MAIHSYLLERDLVMMKFERQELEIESRKNFFIELQAQMKSKNSVYIGTLNRPSLSVEKWVDESSEEI
jgi:hypothetical protein